MPNNKQSHKKRSTTALENVLETDTNQAVFAEIAFLKKRIHLVEGERKANYESNEEILKNNETKIIELRRTNADLKKRHMEMLKSCDNFFLIVSQRLGNERRAYAFRDKTFEQTIDILQCRIGDMKNKLNLQTFKKGRLKAKLDSVIKDEEMFRSILEEGKATKKENPRIMELKTTENGIALMQMKITEAENIRGRYKSMIIALKGENFDREIKITEMTRLINQQKKEISRIELVLQEAQKSRKYARTKLAEVEAETIREYTDREQELFESRLRLKQIRDKMDAIGSKLTFPKFHLIHRDSSISEGLYVGIQATQEGESKPQSVIESVYNRLSEMTGESDPELIVARFQQQREHSKELEVQEKDAKAEVRRSKIRKRFLQDKLNQLKYSGGLRRETLDERSFLINKEIDSTDVQRLEVDKAIINYSATMDEMLVKLHEICTKNNVKIPTSSAVMTAAVSTLSPTEQFVGDKIVMILKHILLKIEQIFEEQEIMISPTFDRENMILSDTEVSITSTILRTSGLMGENLSRRSLDDGGGVRRLSANDETTSNVAMRRLSIIDVISNEGDIVGRNIIPDEQFADIDEIIAPLGGVGGGDKRDNDSPIIHHQTSKKSDSSEEEEAVTRNSIKRQSQILVEAKTRKGRFNPAISMPARRRI